MRPSRAPSTRAAAGLAALRETVICLRWAQTYGGLAPAGAGRAALDSYLLMAPDAVPTSPPSTGGPGGLPDSDADALRIAALVDLARAGDREAFGQLYDHYVDGIYRFVYYKVFSQSLAEELTGDTFERALGAIGSFQWQGKDFRAWLTTIARNLVLDHHKSSRSRLEKVFDVLPESRDAAQGPEADALATLTSELLVRALSELRSDHRDCLVMRFLQGLSITETAKAMGRSEGSVKQLQLRAVRNLAKILPEGIR